MSQVVIPVDLGGSTQPSIDRPPPRTPPTADTVSALISHYVQDRSPAGLIDPVVAFFHGGAPPIALIDVLNGMRFRLSCSPADLSAAATEQLQTRGMERVELDVLTLDRRVLRSMNRGYSPARVLAMCERLRDMGLEVGVTLAPGLPGSTHSDALGDTRRVIEDIKPNHVRIHPALALEGSELAERARSQRWSPMSLSEAVTTVAAMMDLLDSAGIPVIRVGQQPGNDFPVRIAAGPVHPNLRGLVESRRYRARLMKVLARRVTKAPVVLRVHPADIAWAKGKANENIRALRAQFRMDSISIEADPAVPRGHVEPLSPATGK